MSGIKENLEKVSENIQKALSLAGRKDNVLLVAVTKTVPPQKIFQAIEAGITIIGENRVQEAEEKFRVIGNRVRWHMVGHLQRNKVKKALPIFEMIQSIDSVQTAEEIEKRAQKPIDILIEVNSSGEDTKSGIEPEKFFHLVDHIRGLSKVTIRGVMTIGPFTDDLKKIRRAFRITKKLFDQLKEREKELKIDYLSMGMSADYTLAIEEGSNMIRVGTAIFGERSYL